MPQIGELAYKVKFNASELTKGVLTTRQQIAMSKKIILGMQSPLEKYVQGLQNLSAITARHTEIARVANKIENELEKQYLEETAALTGLNTEQRKRLDILTQEERIASKLKKTEELRLAQQKANRTAYMAGMAGKPSKSIFAGIDTSTEEGRQSRDARIAAYRQGRTDSAQRRQAFFSAIDQQAEEGRSSLKDRLIGFKKKKAADANEAAKQQEKDEAAQKKQADQEAKAARVARAQRMALYRQIEASRKAEQDRIAAEEAKAIEEQKKLEAQAAKQARKDREKRMALYRQIEESKRKAAAARDAQEAKEAAQAEAERKKLENQALADARKAREHRMALYRQIEASKQKAIRDRDARIARAMAEEAAAERKELEKQAKAAEQRAADKKAKSESTKAWMTRQALTIGAGVASFDMMRQSIIQTAGFQRNTAILGSQLGSLERGEKMMTEFRKLSNQKSLSFDGLQESAKTMALFGVEASRIMPTLEALGEITGGDSERMKNLSLAFGQTTAAGRLMGQELLQMINAGFNPLQEISRTTGKSVGALRKEMEEGKVTAEMVANALITATTGTGRYAGTMARVANTMAGSLVKWENQTQTLRLEIGKALEPAVVSLTNSFGKAIPTLLQYKDTLGDITFAVAKLGEGLASLVETPGKDAGLGTYMKKGFMSTFLNPLSMIRSIGDFGTMMFSNDKDKMLDAGERIRDTLGPGQLSKEFLAAIDERARSRKEADEKQTKAEDEKSAIELKLIAEKQKETDRQNRVLEMTQKLQDQIDKRKFGAESVEELKVLQEATKEERQRIDALKKQIEMMEKRDKRKKDILSQVDEIKDKVDPNAKLIRALTDIQVMQSLGELSAMQAAKAKQMAMTEMIKDSNQTGTTIAPSLQAGTREAYQALIPVADVMKQQQMHDQRIMVMEMKTLVTVTKDSNKILEEIRDSQPGDGG